MTMEFTVFVFFSVLISCTAAFTLQHETSYNNSRVGDVQHYEAEADFCSEICGYKSGVKCEGDKTRKDTIKCSCEDKSQIFDTIDKQCKACECQNGRCVKDSRGKTKCNCKRGYALQGENTCAPCDCGKKGKCMFMPLSKSAGGLLYIKKCLCDVGSAEKDGICIDCHCGENSKCEFEDDEKICYCIDGYAEKDGVCTKCDCGNGECSFNNGRKICTCDEDYEEINGYCKDKCSNITCHNDGECYVTDGKPVCECLEGYYGSRCEKDECSRTMCHNEGTCHMDFGNAVCVCPEEYEGENCEINKCSKLECMNGGHCAIRNGKPFCRCEERYEGDHCQKDKCLMITCHNDGECYIMNGRAVCKCLDGYSGELCEIDECSVITCYNGGKCNMKYGKAVCECPEEYEGEKCEIDKCSTITCHNGGECYITHGKPGCKCPERYYGESCQIDKCSYIQCENDGYCAIEYGKPLCICKERYEGDRCQLDKCSHLQCKNGGKCIIDNGKAICECTLKYTGESCETARCSIYYPCQNGGYCKDGICKCLHGTSGELCEVIDECSSVCPNSSDVICSYDTKYERAYCECLDEKLGFDRDTQECRRTCNDFNCENGGKCEVTGYSRLCNCLKGTAGDYCEIVSDCQEMVCGKDATCRYDTDNYSAFCKCYDSTMVFDPTEHTCKKPCQDSSDCLNGGVCVKSGSFGFCRCLRGSKGSFCEEVPDCYTMDCGYRAKCEYDVAGRIAMCKCIDEDFAFDSTDFKCKKLCHRASDCKNGGTCTGGFSKWFCRCLNGTMGDFCEKVPECDNLDCGYDAKCVFDRERKSSSCMCDDKRLAFDSISKICKRPCRYDSDCENGGLCMPRGRNSFCHCREGTSGDICDTVDICNKMCGTGDNIVCKYDLEQRIAECMCKDEKYEFDADTKSCQRCDCGGKEISCSIRNGKKICVCPNGYWPRAGKCEKQSCMKKKCVNGKCNIINNEEICSCYEGYFLDGDECRKKTCTHTPCYNGTCIVRHEGLEECICQAGYTLKENVCIRGSCRIDTCYGGQCKTVDGELTCICPEKFHLEGIGCYETVCKIHRCFGGKCVVENNEEICTCRERYILENDVCKKILCEKKNCFGGQCHISDGIEECECPPGYSIFEDVCVKDNIRSF